MKRGRGRDNQLARLYLLGSQGGEVKGAALFWKLRDPRKKGVGFLKRGSKPDKAWLDLIRMGGRDKAQKRFGMAGWLGDAEGVVMIPRDEPATKVIKHAHGEWQSAKKQGPPNDIMIKKNRRDKNNGRVLRWLGSEKERGKNREPKDKEGLAKAHRSE